MESDTPQHSSSNNTNSSLLGLVGWALWICVLVAGVWMYFGNLGAGNLWNSDDALYGHMVRVMLESGDWIHTTWFDFDILWSYPLSFWWMALVSSVAGVDEWGLRLSSALAAAMTLGAFSLWPRQERVGPPLWLYALGFLMVQPLFFSVSQRVLHDALLCAGMVATLGLYHRGARAPGHARMLLLAGFACGLTSLVKSGAGLLPLTVLALDLLWQRRWLLRDKAAWGALAAALGIPLVYYAVTGALGTIGASLYARFFVGLDGHAQGGPWSSVLDTILSQGWVGVLLLVLSCLGLVWAAVRREPLDKLLLIWTVLAFAVLALTRTRLPTYSLLLLLPMSLLAASVVEEVVHRMRVVAVLVPVLMLLMLGWSFAATQWIYTQDMQVALLSQEQAKAPADAMLCTIDVYHVSSVYYTGRKVTHLTENVAARKAMYGVLPKGTIPEVDQVDIMRRLKDAEHFSCLVNKPRVQQYKLAELPGVEIVGPPMKDVSFYLVRR